MAFPVSSFLYKKYLNPEKRYRTRTGLGLEKEPDLEYDQDPDKYINPEKDRSRKELDPEKIQIKKTDKKIYLDPEKR